MISLKGTGSYTVKVEQSYIPERGALSQSKEPLRGGPMYKIGLKAFVASRLLSFSLGVNQRFLDELKNYSLQKERRDQGLLAECKSFSYKLVQAELEIEYCRAQGLSILHKAQKTYHEESSHTEAEETKVAAMLTFCVNKSISVIEKILPFAGASALFDETILRRCFDDAQEARQHHNCSNYIYEAYGKQLILQN